MTRKEFETALDERRLWISEYINKQQRWYLVRRNGKTRTWKKAPERWIIPIKWKAWSTGQISEKTQLDAWFKIQPGPSELVGAELLNVR